MREAWPGQGFLFLAVCELTVTPECQVWLVGQFRLSRYGQKPSSPGAMLGACEAGQVPSRSVGLQEYFILMCFYAISLFYSQIKEGRVIYSQLPSDDWVGPSEVSLSDPSHLLFSSSGVLLDFSSCSHTPGPQPPSVSPS